MASRHLKVAFQMDPIEGIDIKVDSSFRIAFEAQKRGHTIYVYTPDRLSYEEGLLVASGHKITLQADSYSPIANSEFISDIHLEEMDVIWLRQDPPFDTAYITTTYLLDLVDNAVIFNDPFWVRNLPEKILVSRFKEFIPPTLISREPDRIRKFREKYKDIIIKPLYNNGGYGVFKITHNDPNLESLCEMLCSLSKEPFIIQQFLPAVADGDKRVILINGEVAGAINRVTTGNNVRSNMHVGGVAHDTTLTERDLMICDKISPMLKEKGLIFAGLDIIGGYLTEVNLTSPTGIQEIEYFRSINIAQTIWDHVETKVLDKSLDKIN